MTYKRVLYVLSFLFWIKLKIVRIYLGNPVISIWNSFELS